MGSADLVILQGTKTTDCVAKLWTVANNRYLALGWVTISGMRALGFTASTEDDLLITSCAVLSQLGVPPEYIDTRAQHKQMPRRKYGKNFGWRIPFSK